jgi:ABC-2 type transport system ATP-binding protein
MSALTVSDLHKHFDGVRAVDGLSFEVEAGEVFGLLGPNGAGKTTAIRIVMDIFRPDAGTVQVLGRSPKETRSQVGYLPEERGLYRSLKVVDVLAYLGELKGLQHPVAKAKARSWLERVELDEWAFRKLGDLSRGMQQKVQFVGSVLHDPALLILDEPFQGLDPVNVELLKGLIRELRQRGVAILLSAHEMSLVEAMCDRIVLINHGQAVLYGSLRDIKRRFSHHAVRVRATNGLADLPGVAASEWHQDTCTLTLEASTRPVDLLRTLAQRGVDVELFEVESMPLDQIFIRVVGGASDAT